MYLPPMGSLPENPVDPDISLKKILLWNGASFWGGMKAGRGIFLKEKCPVSTCVLSSTRAEAESADLLMFKDHFTMPYFKRPLSQIWMLYLLGID
jgi:glycoprotein 3-alpha-L-fucosyltransferase